MPKSQEEKTQEEIPKEKTKKISQEEFEKKAIQLAESGLTAEKIGEELKKQNIHSNDFSKKISKILREKGLYKSPDLKNVEEKLEKVDKHFKKNKQDKRAKREKDRIFSQRRKIRKYLKLPLK
jgi:ribosomal protein S15P/S13E